MEYEKLNPEFKAAWIANLRSGQYKQGNGALASTEYTEKDEPYITYCCLGIACITKGIDSESIKDSSFITDEDNHILQLLPEDFPQQIVGDSDNSLVSKLSSMNDGSSTVVPLTFPQIADWIEENL